MVVYGQILNENIVGKTFNLIKSMIKNKKSSKKYRVI